MKFLEVAAFTVATVHALLPAIVAMLLVASRYGVVGKKTTSTALGVYLLLAFTTVATGRCPLTSLEQWLLVMAGEPSYEGSFIVHYAKVVGGIELSAVEVWVLAGVFIALQGAVLLWVLIKPPPIK